MIFAIKFAPIIVELINAINMDFHSSLEIIKTYFSYIIDPIENILKRVIKWQIRVLFSLSRSRASGFVFPTTLLLLMVVSLAISIITLRTYNHSQVTVQARNQQVIYNTATPAIDRAKAKLEYLFQKDPRFPSGLPGEITLEELLGDASGVLAGVDDAYTFPDEARMDVNDDDALDASWQYRVDTSGNGEMDATIGYSIILGTPNDTSLMEDASDGAIAIRANALEVRHGPLSGAADLTGACQVEGGDSPIEQGWFQDPARSAILRKNFQVDVYVLPDDATQAVSTLEFHQDRQMSRGNKWGAWFRNDLEVFPGPRFNWNGAMHTAGNLIVGYESFNGYLVSSPFSCLYTRDASEVTVTDVIEDPEDEIPAFQGQFISGRVNRNTFGTADSDKSWFHLFDATAPITGGDDTKLDLDSDSVKNDGPQPGEIALDPVVLVTQGVSQSRKVSGGDPSTARAGTWNAAHPLINKGRLINQPQHTPYVDDFYRADDRYGPKPRYKEKQIPGTIGEPITGDRLAASGLDDEELTRLATNDGVGVGAYGLDGYWERRARAEGLRLVVSQRLELGNAFGWGDDLNDNGLLDDYDDNDDGTDATDDLDSFGEEREAEPLYPANDCPTTRCHETLQRRALRDNLAAVQSLAIYHQASTDGDNGRFPLACYALTAHPGTAQTLETSRTFANAHYGSGIDIDFLTGTGVNGGI
ncbi:MAG: hypothetical protein F6K16_42175 [Symploca sp. SIO2B6]|nr:hypothetical protein [Symploca sp. SIO2B6]